MKIKTVFITVLLLLQIIAFTLQVAATYRTSYIPFNLIDVSWGKGEAIVEPEPGDDFVPLVITVAHAKGEVVVSGVNATLTLPVGFSFPLFQAQDSAPGSYRSGEEIDFDFTVNTAKNLPTGIYYGYLRIEFYLLLGGMTFEGDPWNMSIPIKLLGKSDINYKLNPQMLNPSAVNDVTLTVSNDGSSSAYFLDLDFSAEKTTPIGGRASWTVNKLKPGESAAFPFSLYIHPDLQDKTAEGSVVTTYKSAYDRTLTQTDTIHFTVASLRDLFEVSLSSISLIEGQVNDVSLILNYTGTSTQSKVEVSATAQPPAAIVGPEVWTIDQLNPNQRKSLATQIYAPIAGQSTTLTITVKYFDVMGVKVEETSQIGFIVYSGPEATLLKSDFTNVKAGAINDIPATLINSRDKGIVDVEVSVSAPEPMGVVGLSKWSIPYLRPGEEEELTVNLHAPSASLGSTSYLSFMVKYRDEAGEVKSETHFLGFVVVESAQFVSPVTLYSVNSKVTGGLVNDLAVTIQNAGDDTLYNLEVTLAPMEGGQLIGSEGRWTYDLLTPNEAKSFLVPILVSEAREGGFTITFNIESTDSLGYTRTEMRNLGFVVGEVFSSPLRLYSTTPDIYAGSVFNYNLSLLNLMGEVIKNIEVYASPPPSITFVSTDGRWKIDVIAPGESKTLVIPLYAPTDIIGSGGALTVTLEYTDQNGIYRTEVRNLGFALRGTIDLKPSGVTITPLPAVPGSELTVSGQIFNSGTVTAKAVNVSIIPSHPFLYTAMEGTMVVGDIDVGIQAPFTLNPTVSFQAEEGTYKLQLLITYKDDMGLWQEIPTEIPVTISTTVGLPTDEKPTQEGPLPFSWMNIALGIVIGIIVAWVALRLISRRKKSSEEWE
ncbi:MAG: hypothetical protein GTN80_02020 [Nitrososphaeria archaeon]|nr:hypothetical protein [Nitrososphaeria archaeon]NIN51867.1 hypothetical protein [Nitrososphaeria archaeon]NIQ32415.1 hypothetical protein [Nitrososphaeria archaeon]